MNLGGLSAIIIGGILTVYVVWTVLLTLVFCLIGGWRWDQLGTAAWWVFKIMGLALIAVGLIIGMWSGFASLVGLVLT